MVPGKEKTEYYLELETNGVVYNKDMFEILLTKLPKELVIEILLFEGRIMRAYLRDYIGEVYSKVYKEYFGHRHSLKFITGGFSSRDLLSALPFYAVWSTVIRIKHPRHLRRLKCKKNMIKYGDAIPRSRLVKERKKIEKRLACYFTRANPVGPRALGYLAPPAEMTRQMEPWGW